MEALKDIDAWRDKCAAVAVHAGRCRTRREFLDAPEPHRLGDIVQDLGGEQGVVVAVAPGSVAWRAGPFTYSSPPRDLLLLDPAPPDRPGPDDGGKAPEPPAAMPWRTCLAISAKAVAYAFLGGGAVALLDGAVDRLVASIGLGAALAVVALVLVALGGAALRALSPRLAAARSRREDSHAR